MTEKPTISAKAVQVQHEIGKMYLQYDRAVAEGDNFRELAIGAWEALEDARGSTRPDLYLIEKFDVQVLRYTALATMSYSRAEAIKP